MEALWTRFNPLHVALRELISDGAIGEIRRVVDDFSFLFPYDPGHRLYDPEQGGGALFDQGPYPVSMIQSLLGRPESLKVVGSRAPNGVDDTATLLFGYPDGVAGVGTCTLRANGPNTASVVGTLGRVQVDDNALAPTRMTLYRNDGEPEVFTAAPEGSGYVPQLREVQARVREGATESAVMPHADSLAMMSILTDAAAAIP
jgi:predicted dehydrogenase